MPICKKCQSQKVSKNGIVCRKQRYFCKTRGYSFVSKTVKL